MSNSGSRAAAAGLVCAGSCNLLFSVIGVMMLSAAAAIPLAVDVAVLALAVTALIRPAARVVSAAGWLAVLRGGAAFVVMAVCRLANPEFFFGEGTALLWVTGLLDALEILCGWAMLRRRITTCPAQLHDC